MMIQILQERETKTDIETERERGRDAGEVGGNTQGKSRKTDIETKRKDGGTSGTTLKKKYRKRERYTYLLKERERDARKTGGIPGSTLPIHYTDRNTQRLYTYTKIR